MPAISLDDTVTDALGQNAPVVIGVSGGKDSQAAVIATVAHLDGIGHAGPRILVHADLGMVEWDASLPVCEKLATHFGLELVVVARKAGGLMERWESRWQSSRRRYADLETVTLVPCWSTPGMRFCTSETKRDPIEAMIRKRFPGMTVINVTGVRADESAQRAKQPISDVKKTTINWRPILGWSTEDVFAAIDASGMEPHIAYRGFGMTRVSCRYCIMSSMPDLVAASAQEESHAIYRRMVALEAESTFAFQGSRWLGDVAPHLLDAELADKFAFAKRRAEARKRIEAHIPKELLYVSGWPTRMPDVAEAELLARVRREMCGLFDMDSPYTEAAAIIGRYRDLMDQKAAKEAEKAAKEERRQRRLAMAA